MLGQPFSDRITGIRQIQTVKSSDSIPQLTVQVNKISTKKQLTEHKPHKPQVIKAGIEGIQQIGKTIPTRTKTTLRILNVAMSLFHLTLFITTLVVGDINLNVDVFTLDLSTTNMSTMPDMSNMNGSVALPNFLTPIAKPSEWVTLPLTWITSLFFLLSCVFHFGNAVLWYNAYIYYLEIQRSPFRWIEYTFSASTMMLPVSYAAGILLETELFMIFILIATTMFFGHLTEVVNTKTNNDTWSLPLSERIVPHLLGYVPQISAWAVVLYTFYQNQEGAPDFVPIIIWTELVVFFSFGFVQLSVILRKPSQYYQGEIAYQVLSLVSKGLLGIILFTNVIFLSNWECIVEEIRNKLPSEMC